MFVVDIQGFQFRNSDFYVRELAILDMANGCMVRKFIKLPHMSSFERRFQDQVSWTIRHIHGLSWDGGLDQLQLEDLGEFLKRTIPCDRAVIVKGQNKKAVLCKFIWNHIIDVDEELKCPNWKILKSETYNICTTCNNTCTYHCKGHLFNDLACAQENVHLLDIWYKKIKCFS